MPVDPLVIAVGSGVASVVGAAFAKKIADKSVDYLSDLLRGQDRKAKKKAEDNFNAFLPTLTEQFRDWRT